MKRPRIVCHGFTSVDGRIRTERWSEPAIGTRPNVVALTDRQTLSAMEGDGVITGVEMVAGAPGIAIGRSMTADVHVAPNYYAKRLERPLCIVYDPDCLLRLSTNRFEEGQLVLITSRRASEAYLEQARIARVSYVFAGDDGSALGEALSAIQSHFGSTLFVLRADGQTNSVFMAQGMVDQVSVLIFPGLDTISGASSLFESPVEQQKGAAVGKSLLHISTQTLDGGIVWLRYLVEHAMAS